MYLPVDWPITDLAGRQARRTPSRIALQDPAEGAELSYEAWSSGPIAELAAGLRSSGIEPGDNVGVIAEPGPPMATVTHAAARVGAVLCPLPPDGPPDVIEERCSVADVGDVIHFGRTSTGPFGGDRRGHRYSDLLGATDPNQPYRWGPDETQWLVFTSGTTGRPRAVKLTPANLVSSATASALRLGVRQADLWLACLPMHHVGGLAPLVRSALYGTGVLVQRGFDVDETASLTATAPVTGVSLVPTMLKRLLDDGWVPPKRLRFVLLGGAPASTDLIARSEAAGVPVHPTYGATETASQIATARPQEAFTREGTVGRPLPGLEVSVLGATAEEVPAGESGELFVSGPVVSPGYYGDEAATNRRLADRTFRTRDHGYQDESGLLWVVGRVDTAIVTGGETVHPQTVGSALESHPAVTEAAVVGLPDPEWGEVVAALVVPAEGGSVDVAELLEHVSGQVEPAAVPKQILPVESLPRTASGTIDREVVLDRLRAASEDEGL